jgi:formylglycine-generating enzyme required for sulfatase activity
MNCLQPASAKTFCDQLDGDGTSATTTTRLPTIEEWLMEASRNHTVAYPWGDRPEASCDNCIRLTATNMLPGCGTNFTAAVCTKPSGNSESGLCDMVGNVAEFMGDANGDYLSGQSPTVMNLGGNARGGSFGADIRFIQGFARYEREMIKYPFNGNFTSRNTKVGMRCVWVGGVPH